jgi:hypothetical protein
MQKQHGHRHHLMIPSSDFSEPKPRPKAKVFTVSLGASGRLGSKGLAILSSFVMISWVWVYWV